MRGKRAFFTLIFLVIGQYVCESLLITGFVNSFLWVSSFFAVIWVVFASFFPQNKGLLKEGVLSFLLGLLSTYIILPTPLSAYPAKNINRATRGSFLVKVVEEPRLSVVGGVEFIGQILSNIEGNRENLLTGSLVMIKAIDLPWRNAHFIYKGSIMAIRAKLKPIIVSYNPFSRERNLLRRGIVATGKALYVSETLIDQTTIFDRYRKKFLLNLEEYLGASRNAALLSSLCFGTRDRVSQELEKAFQRSGLAHLLVLSGCHLVAIFFLFRLFFQGIVYHLIKLGIFAESWKLPEIFALTAIWLFALICGLQNATLRAVISLSLLAALRFCERSGSYARQVSCSLILLLLLIPGAIFSVSTQLTYAALYAIAFGIDNVKREGCFHKFKKYILIMFSISLLTSVISLFWFKTLSLFGFFLNPLFAPVFSCVCIQLGLIGSLIGLFSKTLAEIVFKTIEPLLNGLSDTVIFFSSFQLCAIQKISTSLSAVLAIILLVIWFCLLPNGRSRRHTGLLDQKRLIRVNYPFLILFQINSQV